MSASGVCNKFVIVVPNRAGFGELFTSLKLRDLIEKVHCSATVILIVKRYSLRSSHAIIQGSLRKEDFIWDYEDPAVYATIVEKVFAFSPDVVIQFPDFDGEISPALVKRLPPSTAFFIFGEIEGIPPCLGFSPTNFGVFLDHTLREKALDSGQDHFENFLRALPSSLREKVGSAKKEEFAFGYASYKEAFLEYIQLISTIGFEIQKKRKLTIFLVGQESLDVYPHDLREMQETLKIWTIETLNSHWTIGFGDRDSEREVRIICVSHLASTLFDLGMLASLEFPLLVTGDDSFLKGLSTGKPIFREVHSHKLRSQQAFCKALRTTLPEVDHFSHATGSTIPRDFLALATAYETVMRDKKRWKTAIFELLKRADSFSRLGSFFTILTPALAKELESAFVLCRLAQTYLEFGIPEGHPEPQFKKILDEELDPLSQAKKLREYMTEATGIDILYAYALAGGSRDRDLFLACEAKIPSLSSNDQILAYDAGFCTALFDYPNMTLVPLFREPDRFSRLHPLRKARAVADLAVEDQFNTIKVLLETKGFFTPRNELLKAIYGAMLRIIKLSDSSPSFHTFRNLFLWEGLERAERIEFFSDKIVSEFGRFPEVACELLREEYVSYLTEDQRKFLLSFLKK